MSTDISLRILSESLGEKVLVKLRNGKMLRGVLQGYDQHMNLILDQAEEMYDDNTSRQLGVIVVRGDNIIMVSPTVKEKK
ncbi:MAG: LSm family protein [Nitrososphaerota archaeon]